MTVRNRFNNPVLQKEFKLRFRTVKSFVGLFMYLLIFGILALGFIYVLTLNQTYLFFQPEESRALFSYLAIIQLVMLLFITPGLTAGVVSGERERQTLNILLTTTLSSFQIIVGKLLSSVAYLLLLLLASLPLFSFVFLFGGVAPEEILLVFFMNLITVLTFGVIGIFFSTLLKRTIAAVISSYVLTLFLTIGTVILFFISIGISRGLNPGGIPLISYFLTTLNPVFALLTALNIDVTGAFDNWPSLPVWMMYVIVYTLVFIFCTWMSTLKLRKEK